MNTIAASQIQSFIGSKVEKFYFNSPNHFIEVASKYIGCSPGKVRKELSQFDYTFEDHQIKFKEYVNCDIKAVPNYILQTRLMNDRSLYLSEKEYKILLYLDGLNKGIQKGAEEYKQVHRGYINWMPFLYPRIKTIAKGTGYTYEEVKYSLHKLCYYFENFYRKMSPNEWANKKYIRAKTKTIELPKRSEWKKIIESVIYQNIGNEMFKFKLPKLITEKEYKTWQKIARNQSANSEIPITLVRFQENLTNNEIQAERLQKGKEEWEKQRESWEILKNQVVLRIVNLVEEDVLSEMQSARIISEIRNENEGFFRDMLRINDLEFRELFNWNQDICV